MYKIWFIHPPKTGGISVVSYMKNNENVNLKYYDHEQFTKERYNKLDPVIILSTLRCPIQQTKSYYSYIKTNRPEDNSLKSFSDWIRNPNVFIPDCFGSQFEKWMTVNFYVRFFGSDGVINSGCMAPSFDVDGYFSEAVNLLRSFDYIFDTSNLTSQFNKFAGKYNLLEFNFHINVSNFIDVSKEDIEYLKKQRAQDIELCKMFNIKITGD
jgi:uncharacterized protein YdcH (DUF465 family)